MSLVGYSCSGESRLRAGVIAWQASDMSAWVDKAVTDFDAEEKARRDQQVIKDNDALRKREQSFLAQDRPLFAISKACLDLVERFVVVAAIAAAISVADDERLIALAANRFSGWVTWLGWLEIHSARDLVQGGVHVLTVVALGCILCMAFLFYRDLAAVLVRSKVMKVVLRFIIAPAIIVSSIILMAAVIRLSA